MSLSQIEYFVAVSETGHVGRAAGALRIAQPAVSRQIRSLEDELGVRLFLRTARGMQLSEAGSVFLQYALGILTQIRAAKRAVHETGGSLSRDFDDPVARVIPDMSKRA